MGIPLFGLRIIAPFLEACMMILDLRMLRLERHYTLLFLIPGTIQIKAGPRFGAEIIILSSLCLKELGKKRKSGF